ncbi:DUF2336 domain-containing protein [Caulobacter sp. NIBR2454]|uniref:DUF2336 domain-containing protein n=1 Tax=Caulobacter sp. NIBR2454 TaxID=3015996 RepID=UPI0022B6BC16|nr:DUF2336 domain-containing protein [Caulobacter sp. NIBR2454]
MSTTRGALTDADIRMLVKGATPDERAVAAHKICRSIENADLNDEDRKRAQEILRVMAADAAELVRRALAVTLRASPLVPRDVANKLARDVDTIAIPILMESPSFTDADLAEIVRLGDTARQTAVARRPTLTPKVTDALAEHAGGDAVRTAIANDNAQFSESGLGKVLKRFEAAESILTAVAYRRVLPLSVTERLVEMVSEGVRAHLLAAHPLPAGALDDLIDQTKERAVVDLVDQAGQAADLKDFVRHLNLSGRLTPSLLLRGLAHGHMSFFEWGMAELAGVPHHRTWLMIHDAGPLGLRAIYERAALPARLYGAFRAGVDAYHSLEIDGDLRDQEHFQRRMLERFLTQPQTPGREDADYLLGKLDRLRSKAKGKSKATVGAA